MLQDFRKFLMRGNVIELAVGIVLGAAFSAVVKSFVDDVLMPPIGKLIGGVDFTNLFISLNGQHYPTLAAAKAAGAATVNYGVFINTVIAFLIVAAVVYQLVKGLERLTTKPAEAEAEPPACPFCREVISASATRCPHCTSQLVAPAAGKSDAAGRRRRDDLARQAESLPRWGGSLSLRG
jgi:large conductance mechanosensitive channel